MKWLKKSVVVSVAMTCGVGFAADTPKEAGLRAFADAVGVVAPVLGQQARNAARLLQAKCGATPSVEMVRAVLMQPEMMPTPLDPKTSDEAMAPAVAKVACE